MNPETNRGTLLVVSAASGTGKTTLCTALRKQYPEIRYSISSTTRKPREGEVDGVDYHFLSVDAFKEGIGNGAWAEWAEVHGNYYGTSAQIVNDTLDAGDSLLLEIDVQGARQIKERFPEAVTLFILPPSMEILRARLEGRGTDAQEIIERRLAAAESEIAQKDGYTHQLINDDLETATAEFIALVGSYLDA